MLEIFLGARKSRKLKRSIRNYRLTLLSLLLTIVVLRGTIGAGKFGTPQQDFLQLRSHLHFRKFPSEPHHIAKEFQAKSYSYNTFDVNKFLIDENNDDDEEIPNPNEPFSLGPKIFSWDEQRQNWLLQSPGFPNFIRPNKPRVLLVTGSSPQPCDVHLGDHYLLKSIKNKVDYCRLHGIEVYYNMAVLEPQMPGIWGKLPLIRKLLISHPEVEFLWWMESDALFTDMTLDIHWERHEGYNLVMHRLKETMNDHTNWIGLNTGSFLLRNCQWGLDMLETWAEGKKVFSRELDDGSVVETDDQSVMLYLLTNEQEKWGGKVYFESDYHSNGYEQVSVDRYGGMMGNYDVGFGNQGWPFISQFDHCKLCGEFRDFQYSRCLQLMDQALEYGDKQIQQMYGFSDKL